MWAIYLKFPQKRKQLLTALHGKVRVRETQLPEYIIAPCDPTAHIPQALQRYVTVMDIDDSHTHAMLKNAGTTAEVRHKKFSVGDAIKIKSGRYAGFTGLVSGSGELPDEYMVEIGIWGHVLREFILAGDMDKTYVADEDE